MGAGVRMSSIGRTGGRASSAKPRRANGAWVFSMGEAGVGTAWKASCGAPKGGEDPKMC